MMEQIIGNGKFSTVYRCKNKNTNKIYAIKTIELKKLSKNALNAIRYIINNIEMKARY